MIKINVSNRTKSIIVNGDVFDEVRKGEKHITFLGITIWRRTFGHTIVYTKVDSNNVSPIGFKKRHDEETKEK